MDFSITRYEQIWRRKTEDSSISTAVQPSRAKGRNEITMTIQRMQFREFLIWE